MFHFLEFAQSIKQNERMCVCVVDPLNKGILWWEGIGFPKWNLFKKHCDLLGCFVEVSNLKYEGYKYKSHQTHLILISSLNLQLVCLVLVHDHLVR